MMPPLVFLIFATSLIEPNTAVTIRAAPNAYAFEDYAERDNVDTLKRLLLQTNRFKSHAKPRLPAEHDQSSSDYPESTETKYASLVNLLNKLKHDDKMRRGDTVRIYRISNPEVLQEYRNKRLDEGSSSDYENERVCKCGLDEHQEVDAEMIRLTKDDRSRCNCDGRNMLDLTLRSLLKAGRRANEKLHLKDVKDKLVGEKRKDPLDFGAAMLNDYQSPKKHKNTQERQERSHAYKDYKDIDTRVEKTDKIYKKPSKGKDGNIGWRDYDSPKKLKGHSDDFGTPHKSKARGDDFKSPKKSKGKYEDYETPKKSRGNLDDYDFPKKSKGKIDDYDSPKKSKGNIDDYDTPKKSKGHIDDYDTPKKSKGNIDDYDTPKKSQGNIGDYDVPKKSKGNSDDYDTPKKSKSHVDDFLGQKNSKGHYDDFDKPKAPKILPTTIDWRQLVKQEAAEKAKSFGVEPAAEPSKALESKWGSYKNLKIPTAHEWAKVGVDKPQPVARPQLRYRSSESLRQRGGGGSGGFGRTSIPMPGKKRLYDDE